MKTSTYRIRLTRLLVLGAIVAGAIASTAGAYGVRPPDEVAATALYTTPAGQKAYGERWQRIAQVYRDLELAQNGPSAQGLKADGLRWQGIAQAYQQLQAEAGTSSFDWGDWAIGLGAGLGIALAFGGALIVAPRVRRTGAAATG